MTLHLARRCRRGGFGGLLLLVLLCANACERREFPQVTVHNRGQKIRLSGQKAKRFAAVCADLVETVREGSAGGVTPNFVEHAREREVSVEVDYGEPRVFRFAVKRKNRVFRAQYLLISITGEETGPTGRNATIYIGGKAPWYDSYIPHLLNPPDEQGIQYGSLLVNAHKGNVELRQLVASLGVAIE